MPKTKKFSSKDRALLCAKAAIDKKAVHSIVFEVGKLGAFTDYFLITSATNERQVQAIADEIRKSNKEHDGSSCSVEGYDDARWVLIDLGDVVVHVFQEHIREFYDLESLWADAPRVVIPEEFYASAIAEAIQSSPNHH